MSFIEDLAYQRNVVAGEAGGLFPDVTVAVQADDGQRVAESGTRLPAPDADFDQAVADFMYGLRGHMVCLCCDRPENCVVCSELCRRRFRPQRLQGFRQAAERWF